jgi:hypothetical protein
MAKARGPSALLRCDCEQLAFLFFVVENVVKEKRNKRCRVTKIERQERNKQRAMLSRIKDKEEPPGRRRERNKRRKETKKSK